MKDNRLIVGILVAGLFFSPVASFLGKSSDIGSVHAEEQLSADSPPSKLKAKLAEIDKAIDTSPSAKAYGAKANVLVFMGEKSKALTAINKAIQLSPNTGKYYAYRGLIKSTVGDLDGTIKDIEKAKSISYLDSDYLGLLALAQADKADFKNALKNAEAALREENDNYSALYARGKVRTSQKNYQKALSDFGKAITKNGKLPEIYLERAAVWEKLGNKKNALSDRAIAQKLKSQANR